MYFKFFPFFEGNSTRVKTYLVFKIDYLQVQYVVQSTSMNGLPVIGSLCLRKDFWDRHGANIATRYKEMYGGERLFQRSKKRAVLERDQCFSATVLS